ncbi:MAG: NifB/NifX family molybdenum-iron cluster-binding protein [Sphaerochaetaceae bacterium]|nr:NifB/NifX family molybdenum-iron cluster-binding protein [Sphaerochaetaceae bacterium]
MKIAIPTANGKLDGHFGHTRLFTIYDVDDQSKKINSKSEVEPPKHEPGVLPRFLRDQKVDVILTGGMGPSAQSMLEGFGVKVVMGVASVDVDQIVADYLADSLVAGANTCDH